MIRSEKLHYDYVNYDEEDEKAAPEVTHALIDVDLDISEGQFIAILGHNGSGKSTLAKHINALLLPTEGTMWVRNMDTKDPAHLWDIRQTAGMVFQNPDNQIIASVVEEDVAFGPENIGVPTDEIWERVGHALEVTGMTAFREDSPNNLSGGQKQRVAIAGVMAMRPKCIVMDEPTAMLDPEGRKEVLNAVHELNKKENVTVILITHFMEEAIDADRVIIMEKGRIVMHGTPREIFARVEELERLRLDVPQVTRLAYELSKEGVSLPEAVLTREEFVNGLARIPHRTGSGSLEESKAKENAGGNDQQPILSMENVSFVYSPKTAYEKRALRNISLDIYKGRFIGMIGHTGCGKSTLIQQLNALLKPTEGRVLFNGEDIWGEGFDRRALRFKVGLVFQYPEYQLFEEDVITDVCFGPKNMGLSPEEARAAAERSLKDVGVSEDMYLKSPFELSGGQKRRVAIAGVLAMDPEVLILDEPTAGLDPRGRTEILDQLALLKKQRGITIILVSHSMEDMADYADRVIVLNKGEIVMEGDPESIFSEIGRLEEMGLAAPEVTYMIQDLRKAGFDVDTRVTSVDAARETILKALEN